METRSISLEFSNNVRMPGEGEKVPRLRRRNDRSYFVTLRLQDGPKFIAAGTNGLDGLLKHPMVDQHAVSPSNFTLRAAFGVEPAKFEKIVKGQLAKNPYFRIV